MTSYYTEKGTMRSIHPHLPTKLPLAVFANMENGGASCQSDNNAYALLLIFLGKKIS
jgi:hypothetical protein